MWGASACLPGPAVADDTDVAQFRAQLKDVFSIRDGYKSKLSCFQSKLDLYRSIKAATLVAVGEAKTRLDDLNAAATRLRAEVEGFSASLREHQSKLDEKRARMEEIQAEGRNLAEKLDTCRKVFFLDPGICNWGEDRARDAGNIRNIPREIDIEQPQLVGAQARVDEDASRLAASHADLARTEADLMSTRQRYDQSNETVERAMKINMLLAATVKDYQSGLDNLDTKIRRIDLLLKTYDEDDRDEIEKTISAIRFEQPSTADRSAETLPGDARAGCAG